MTEDGCSIKLPTPQLYPWLMVSHANGEQSTVCTFYSFLEKSYYTTHIPDMSTRSIRMMANCNGWLVLQDETNFECLLLNIFSLEKIKLPNIRWTALRGDDYFIMTAPPTSPKNSLFIFSPSRARALVWRRGRPKWKKLGYDPQELLNVMACNQKVYGVTQHKNLVVCDIVGNTFKITKLGPIPDTEFRELITSSKHLIGSEGDMFWIHISRYPWDDPGDVKFIDVYKFDQTNAAWNRVESIDGRIFFLNGAHHSSCSAASSDMKGNCIHFFVNEFASLCTFDMATNTLAISEPCPESCGPPICSQIII